MYTRYIPRSKERSVQMPSFDRPADPGIPPSPWVMRFAHLIRKGGHVLDVAAGHGRHTKLFSLCGCSVTAVDEDVSGLSSLSTAKNVRIIEANLEGYAWPFEANSFDGIVVTNYLHRPHFPHLVDTLKQDGVLIFETFGQGNEKLGRPRNPDFLLAPGELLDAFSSNLLVVAYEHCTERTPRHAVRQRLCAVRADESVIVEP